MTTNLFFGKTSLSVPDYVVCLTQEEVNKVRAEGKLDEKIVGAGVHYDCKVTIILATGQIRIFDPKEYFIPAGPFIPQEDGYTVYLPNIDNRWPVPTRGFSVQSSWIVQKSRPAFVDAELFVNNKSLGKFDLKEDKTNKT